MKRLAAALAALVLLAGCASHAQTVAQPTPYPHFRPPHFTPELFHHRGVTPAPAPTVELDVPEGAMRRRPPREYLFLADTDARAVLIYPFDASGDVLPARIITGARTTLQRPVDVKVDESGRIYVLDAGTRSVTIFAAGSMGDPKPLRRISGAATRIHIPLALAVDPHGLISVAEAQDRTDAHVLTFAPDADGDRAPLSALHVPAVPVSVALDKDGNTLVAVTPLTGIPVNEVLTYAPSGGEGTLPIRALYGGLTALGAATPTRWSITISPKSDALIAALPQGRIDAFARTAEGDAEPGLRYDAAPGELSGLAGITTGRSGAIAVASANGIAIYVPRPTGGLLRIRAIAGPHTLMRAPSGIATGPG